MHRKKLFALRGAAIVVLARARRRRARRRPVPTVTVASKAMTKTLLRPTRCMTSSGWITKDGTPRGKCSGASAAGALDVATHGTWTGT